MISQHPEARDTLDPDAQYVPIWPLVVFVVVTLAPVAIILIDTVQDKPAGMPFMRAVSHPEVGTAAKVYAMIIGMLVWLVSVPGTIVYSVVLAGSWIVRRWRRAQHGIM